MSPTEILVDRSAGETRVAIIEGGRIRELFVKRAGRPWRLGQIVVARVTALGRGGRHCFLDLGGEPGFLDEAPEAGLHEGALLPVQVVAEPWRDKAARASARLSLDGSFTTLASGRGGTGVSRRITGRGERKRMRRAVDGLAPEGTELIVRAGARGRDGAAVAQDARALVHRWREMQARARQLPAGSELEPAPGPVARARSRSPFAPVREGRDGMLFDDEGLDDGIAALLERRVEMANGVTLLIDEVEALTAIDVDLAGGSLDGTAGEALGAELAWQIRVRRLAGLIVIDVPRMRRVRDRVVAALEEAFGRETGAPVVHGWTRAGLLELTRPRLGPSLRELYCADQAGVRLRSETVACDVLRRMPGRVRGVAGPRIRCAPEVAAALSGPLRGALDEVERRLGGAVAIEPVSGALPEAWWIDGE